MHKNVAKERRREKTRHLSRGGRVLRKCAQSKGIQLECTHYALREASTVGIQAFAGASSRFLRRRTDRLCARGINQRARARILKTTRNHERNADSRRFNTTIYTHVPLHDIDSIQSDERFIFERASISHARGKLNGHGPRDKRFELRTDAITQRASLMNYELQSAERSSS